ncbi:26S proteasome non-ATPase regulatory subunit 3-like protein [Thalictrum thalictroides]|uniref:26S proteasome non-ATPase regulatory subunit 3-like protein n=1 Tax=Thalictrum thalictroides TaxID=46969 RepID=A0A7J6XCN8_THATH|nr:26S proteasome non-ATPase regulatory subunit 3-like protein [Thalictrum thalictroides]
MHLGHPLGLPDYDEDEHDMEVDTATSATPLVKQSLPELEIYCYLLVLIFLIDQKKFSEAKSCSSAGIVRLRNINKRTVDVLASRLYFYYSLSYELTGDLAEIRGLGGFTALISAADLPEQVIVSRYSTLSNNLGVPVEKRRTPRKTNFISFY